MGRFGVTPAAPSVRNKRGTLPASTSTDSFKKCWHSYQLSDAARLSKGTCQEVAGSSPASPCCRRCRPRDRRRRRFSDPNFEIIETDVYIGPRTGVVCDGHDLPFADGSFDAVICQAVLEHVLDPWRVASEITRVLCSDGYVYSEVPFIQQVHLGAFDFTRFTLLGHRRLWRHFDEIRSGAHGGPGMALTWSIMYFLRGLLPARLLLIADRVTSLTFFWLKYLDGILVTRPSGIDAASGTFFLGKRRSAPIDDRTIVRGYRGAGPRLTS